MGGPRSGPRGALVAAAAVIALTSPVAAQVGIERCTPGVRAAYADGLARADRFDLAGAAEHFAGAVASDPACDAARVARAYARGLAARDAAFRAGGSPEALQPIRDAAQALDRLAETDGRDGHAEVARLGLLAAAAAAQTERAEMAVFLAQATAIEARWWAAGEPSLPVVSAHELAGELWLWVDRYREARDAFDASLEHGGVRGRALAGLGRAADRLGDRPAACRAYRALLAWWGSDRRGEPAVIADARAEGARCAGAK